MRLDVLSDRISGAAEAMATDFLLLQRAPDDRAYFRHYGWSRPAFTFGYSQKIDFVRTQLPPGETVELCRRPTGGGVVDHRDDWTYAVVVPRAHALYEARAIESYRTVHACLAEALQDLGVTATLQETCEPCPTGDEAGPAGVCFTRAERFDVVAKAGGTKIAGAAQKRSKRALLVQGSIARAVVGPLDWDLFGETFVAKLGRATGLETDFSAWPELAEDELAGLVEQYSAAEWNAFL